MSETNNNKFYMLNYSHEEIQLLLETVDKYKDAFLTIDEYNKLIKEIGLDNISTFDGNYYSLDMRPIIPSRTSQLYNNTTYQTEKDIVEYDDINIEPIRQDVELLLEYTEKIDKLELEDMLQDLEEVRDKLILFEMSLDESNETLYDIKLYVSNHEEAIQYINEKIETLKNLIDVRNDSLENIINKQISELIIENHSQNYIIEHLTTSVDELNTRIDELNPEGLVEQFNELVEKVNEYQTSWLEKMSVVDTANANYENAMILLSTLDQKIVDLSNIVSDINDYHEDLIHTIKRLQDEIYEICNSIDNLTIETRNTIDEFKTQIELRLENFANTINSRVDELENLINNFNDLYTEIDIISQAIESINNSISQINTKLNGVDFRLNNLENNLEIINEAINRINESINNLDIRLNNLNSKLEELRSQIEDKINEEIEKIKKELAELQAGMLEHIVLTEAEFNNLSEEEQNATDKLYLITDGQNITVDLTTYQNELESLKALVASLESRIEELENKE